MVCLFIGFVLYLYIVNMFFKQVLNCEWLLAF